MTPTDREIERRRHRGGHAPGERNHQVPGRPTVGFPPVKILVTTRHLATGSTSEGTCTVKFANLLSERDHDVICLNGNDSCLPAR